MLRRCCLTASPFLICTIMNTGQLTQPFRAIGLMHLLDKLKFYYQRMANRTANQHFVQQHPDFVLPPDYMMFESFQVNYERYYKSGQQSAQWLIDLLSPHVELNHKQILDWGCGPARVIRHFPPLLPNCSFYGTDYNAQTIDWCQQHIPQVQFSHNQLSPPLSYPSYSFDVIYGISIFTHLSEPKHLDWYQELIRVAKTGAVLLLTTQGEAFKEKMTTAEQQQFEAGQLITRGKVVEGHRVYSAFHPPAYMKQLFSQSSQILEHRVGRKVDWGVEQDVWVLKKL